MKLVLNDRPNAKLVPMFGAISPRSVLARLGGLRTETIGELKDQWRSLFSAEPPLYNRANLEARLSYRIQELAFGGLRAATVKRLETLGEQLDGGNVTLRRIRTDDKPVVGTQLIRHYQGTVHTVTVTLFGYEWEGRPYRSLSAIARAITGTRWNGWTFFGLKNRS